MVRMTRRGALKLAGLSLPMAASGAAGAQPSRSRPYLILSCDGGGIRGLLTAKVIERLQNAVPFLDKVDLFAGTSTGGIIALGLALNLSPAELVALYRVRGPEIFTVNGARHPSRSRFLDFLSGLDAKVRALLRSLEFDPLDLLHPRYSNAGLKRVLTEFFGNATMGDLNKSALVTTLRLYSEGRNWTPLVLHNVGEENADAPDRRVQDSQTLSTTLIDAALCTSAAPLYFPPYLHPDFGFCVDGGLFANCPASVALGLACRANKGDVQSIRILSIGTGVQISGIDIPHSMPFDRAAEYGALAWLSPIPRGVSLGNKETLTPAFPLISALLDASSASDSYVCDQALEGNYHRLQMNLPKPIALDDDSKDSLDFLEEVAERIPKGDWNAATDWLKAQIS
jgi:predicted acylesterase/phospholipase RssA